MPQLVKIHTIVQLKICEKWYITSTSEAMMTFKWPSTAFRSLRRTSLPAFRVQERPLRAPVRVHRWRQQKGLWRRRVVQEPLLLGLLEVSQVRHPEQGENNFFKKMGQPRPLFRLFSVFSNKHR